MTDLSCRPIGSYRHTHTRIHLHTSKNSSDFGHYKIKIQFQKFFSDIVYNVKNKIDFAKNRGARPPGSAPAAISGEENGDFYATVGTVVRTASLLTHNWLLTFCSRCSRFIVTMHSCKIGCKCNLSVLLIGHISWHFSPLYHVARYRPRWYKTIAATPQETHKMAQSRNCTSGRKSDGRIWVRNFVFLLEFNSNPSSISLSFGDICVWHTDGRTDNAYHYYNSPTFWPAS